MAHLLHIADGMKEDTMEQDTRNLIGLLACVALIATLLGGCLPRYCPPLAADWSQEVCECATDIDCETRCGGEY